VSIVIIIAKDSCLSKDEESIISQSRFVVTESLKGPSRPSEVINGLLMPEAHF
jgi:hypothetical protein